MPDARRVAPISACVWWLRFVVEFGACVWWLHYVLASLVVAFNA